MLRFMQKSDKAVVRAGDLMPGKWWGLSVLNVTFTQIGTLIHMYFRGPVGSNDNYHAIGCWTQPVVGFDPFNQAKWTDRGIVLQPSDLAITGTVQKLSNPNIIYFGGAYLLYFIIKTDAGTRTHVATSADGLTFTDVGDCLDPSAATFGGGGAGIAVVGSEIWMMNFPTYTGSDFKAVARKSTNGVNFTSFANSVILPDGTNGWRGKSLSTGRLVFEDPYVYALVCASPDFSDYNEAVGMFRAHKSDYATWTEYAANPVYLRATCGSESEGAAWTMAVADVNGTRFSFYEGAGSRGLPGSAVSNGARDTAYYNYNVDTFSQVFGSKTSAKPYSEIWADGDLLPSGNYQLRNMKTLGYLAPLGGATADGTPLAAYLSPTVSGAVWPIARLDGFYELNLGGKRVEVGGSSRTTGYPVSIFTAGAGAHYQQDWHLIPTTPPRSGAGLYLIINRKSGMCMSVDRAASGSGAMVSQRPYDGTASQVWAVSKLL